jgi:hypothetical protein
VVEEVVFAIIRDVEVRVAVVVVISPGDTLGKGRPVYSRSGRNILKRAVTFVSEELAWGMFVSNKDV